MAELRRQPSEEILAELDVIEYLRDQAARIGASDTELAKFDAEIAGLRAALSAP